MNEMRKLMEVIEQAQTANSRDTVKLDIPLLIRLLEFSREDAQTDIDLHSLADNLINLSPDGDTLTMADYEELVAGLADKEDETNYVESLTENYSDFSGLTFDLVLSGDETDKDAIDYARGMVWSEIETTINDIKYARYISVVDGVKVYHDYGADYYFFAPAETAYDPQPGDDEPLKHGWQGQN